MVCCDHVYMIPNRPFIAGNELLHAYVSPLKAHPRRRRHCTRPWLARPPQQAMPRAWQAPLWHLDHPLSSEAGSLPRAVTHRRHTTCNINIRTYEPRIRQQSPCLILKRRHTDSSLHVSTDYVISDNLGVKLQNIHNTTTVRTSFVHVHQWWASPDFHMADAFVTEPLNQFDSELLGLLLWPHQ
eukprot:357806-Chlamydomonas_euryale.AAC.6